MSDTPRTDQIEKLAYWFQDDMTPVCESRFVRSLERELNAANDRIKRLEEALEAVANVIGPIGKSTWVSDDELNQAWELYMKTKEDKP